MKVVSIRSEKESIFKTITYYELETTSSLLNLYELNKVYGVARRFNDFKQLHDQLVSCEDYKGFAIPPLPSENGIT